ncbi:MAG: hypothetical protein IT219_08495 [Bacteroidales bacterium]|jgi:hypothetical protein|nr:hypothetical protein [Bacteroidales bacterium]
MRRATILFASLLTLSAVLFSGCGNGSKNKLIGRWKVTDVKTQFDETKVNPSTLQQVAELEKQTILNFVNDSSLVIMMGEKNFDAFYTFDAATGKIFYSFEGKGINMTDLGVYSNSTIVSNSETPVGTITVTYSSSK